MFESAFTLDHNKDFGHQNRMKKTLILAGGVAFNSAMCLFKFPGGLPKTDGNWLFLQAGIAALCISMTVLIVGMTAGPIFWKKVEVPAKKAMPIAIVFMAIAIHEILLMTAGDDFWMRVYFKGLYNVFMGSRFCNNHAVWVLRDIEEKSRSRDG